MKRRVISILHTRSKELLLLLIAIVGSGLLFVFFSGLAFLHMKSVYLEKHLEGHFWDIPSTIYAQAPLLQKGSPQSQQWVIDYLKELRYQRTNDENPGVAQYSVRKNTVIFCPNAPSSKRVQPVRITFRGDRIDKITRDAQREPLRSYQLEPMPLSTLFGTTWEKRTLIKYEELPPHLIQAVLAIEDRRFFRHSGVDGIAIARAAWHNLKTGQLQGGSTITQQLVKNFYLTRKKSFSRKANEAVLAFLLERKLSKERILELYLNDIYLGQRGPISIQGVAEASRVYFGKDVRHINVAEAALLAGMIQAPTRYNPYEHPEKAKERRDIVLLAMKNVAALSPAQYEESTQESLKIKPYDPPENKAPYFVSYVRRALLEKYQPEEIYNGNLQVYTTLDLEMQEAARKALENGLARIDKIRGNQVGKKAEGCLIAVNPRTGEIKAFVGGRNFTKSQYDRITQAFRQPGSTFKPLVYAAALESPYGSPSSYGSRDAYFSPATLLFDEPWVLQIGRKTWQPVNYDGQYHGVVTARQALAQSMNVATARLAQQVGIHRIHALAKKLGLQKAKAYPAMALGAVDVTPLEMVGAYTAFANEGLKTELTGIKEIKNPDGYVAYDTTQAQRVIRPETAFIITDMLRSVVTSGTASGIRRYGLTRPIAGKTGTSDEFRDAWFVGYTPDLLCLVWTGYDDNTPIKLNAPQAAVPIWAEFMTKALRNTPSREFQTPPGVIIQSIDPNTGKLATPYCANVAQEVFIQGTEPTEDCNDYYHYSPYLALEYLNNNQYGTYYSNYNDSEGYGYDEEMSEEEAESYAYQANDPDVSRTEIREYRDRQFTNYDQKKREDYTQRYREQYENQIEAGEEEQEEEHPSEYNEEDWAETTTPEEETPDDYTDGSANKAAQHLYFAPQASVKRKNRNPADSNHP